jgi:hypothetical protein
MIKYQGMSPPENINLFIQQVPLMTASFKKLSSPTLERCLFNLDILAGFNK